MKRLILFMSLIFLLGSINSPLAEQDLSSDAEMRDYYEKSMNDSSYEVAKAKVLKIVYDDTKEKRDTPLEADIRYQHMEIEILNGNHKKEKLTVRHTIERIMPGSYIFKAGDKILLRYTQIDGKIDTVKIQEKVRDNQVYLIVGLFVVLILAIGGISGFKTLISLGITIAIIIFAYIPMIIRGYNPIMASLLVAILAIIVTLLIISGRNKKTFVAILGTCLGVVAAGLLAFAFGNFAKLTGLASDNAISLAYIPHFRGLDYKGLLFGTILIGAIGAIMDVAISIASSLWELKEVHPDIKRKDMISSGMNIGRDMMGSMSNTLILAYVGTTLHLIILFIVYKIYFVEIINLDSIATEIIRAMAGSIGLIITIPLTVLVSSLVYLKKN